MTQVVLYLAIVIATYALLYVTVSWLMGRVFDKFNEPKWYAWIPLYNLRIWYRIAGMPGWFALALPLVIAMMGYIVFFEGQTISSLNQVLVGNMGSQVLSLLLVAMGICLTLTDIFILISYYRIPRELGQPLLGLWLLLGAFVPLLWLAFLALGPSRPSWNLGSSTTEIYPPAYSV